VAAAQEPTRDEDSQPEVTCDAISQSFVRTVILCLLVSFVSLAKRSSRNISNVANIKQISCLGIINLDSNLFTSVSFSTMYKMASWCIL
jgi:hypothetical protein